MSRRKAVLVCAALTLCACTPDARGLEWEMVFEDSWLESKARAFDATTLDDGCDATTTVHYRAAFGRDESPPAPLRLPPGDARYNQADRSREANAGAC